MQPERIHALLQTTYWAKNRTRETVEKSIETSVCFGVYSAGAQIGFARAITDHCTAYTLVDVVIAQEYRAQGLGKALVGYITDDAHFAPLYGNLSTKDADGLYQKFGFERNAQAMHRIP